MPAVADPPSWKAVALGAALFLVVLSCAAIWVWAAVRWWCKRPVVPYQPRRPVPWGAFDLVLVVAFYFTAWTGIMSVMGALFGHDAAKPPVALTHGESGVEHVVAQLLLGGNPWIVGLCIVVAVVVAPCVEELLFRVMFQGYLEALGGRVRRHIPTLRRLIPRGAGPIALVSLSFAAMHIRSAGPPVHAESTVFFLAVDSTAKLLAAAFAVLLVRSRAGADAADLGWAPDKIWGDVRLGLAAFVAMVPPLYIIQSALLWSLPKGSVPDPIPLFFFAVMLGTIYFRTHRIVPLIAAHAAFNAASLTMVWLS